MRGTYICGPGDVRSEERDDPKLEHATDAIISVTATCVCGSDLWYYRGLNPVTEPTPMGHEYVGVVQEVGRDVRSVKPGQFVVGSFLASDNTCEICKGGFQSSCVARESIGTNGAQAEFLRVPLADGTLVPTADMPRDDLVPGLLAASDVLGTGWFGAIAADVKPGNAVVVVGDGAVGLMAVLAAKHLGASRIIAISRHADRQNLAREFGATDVVAERGDQGVAAVHELTRGLGADSVIEAVGTQESILQAIHSTRAGGALAYLGVAHGVQVEADLLFSSQIRMLGGPAPVRRFLPELLNLVWSGQLDPSPVFDRQLPLAEAAEGYKAMDDRRAIKVLLKP